MATSEKGMDRFFYKVARWSYDTFGGSDIRGPIGPLRHLAKEVQEAIENPKDVEEYADLMHLVFDAAWRAGIHYSRLLNACWDKLEKNKARKWSPSIPDQPTEHIKEKE